MYRINFYTYNVVRNPGLGWTRSIRTCNRLESRQRRILLQIRIDRQVCRRVLLQRMGIHQWILLGNGFTIRALATRIEGTSFRL